MRTVLLFLLLGVALAAPAAAQTTWLTFKGPMGHEYDRLGTDGTDLYIVTLGDQLWRYRFDPGAPNFGVWTRLADAPRTVCTWDSYRGLAHQVGWLYTTAAPKTGGGRTLLRYEIAKDKWEVWQDNLGKDLTCNASGNGLFMHPLPAPANLGLGFGAWHAGGFWISFDWNNKRWNHQWMKTLTLYTPDADWVSRNESITWNGQPLNPVYYSTHNDKIAGLSSGDVIYSFDIKNYPPTVVAKKPWMAGFGQCLQFIAKGDPLNPSNEDVLWFFRGSDGVKDAKEGWSVNGTNDGAIWGLTSKTWLAAFKTPRYMGYGTDCVMVGDALFLKAAGSATRADTHNDIYMVAVTGAHTVAYGKGCPTSLKTDPRIHPNGAPAAGNTKFAMKVDGSPGGAGAILFLGASNTTLGGVPLPLDLGPMGLPGCWLNTAIAMSFPATLTTGGSGSVSQGIPANPALVGARAYYQWAVMDSALPGLFKTAFSAGAAITIR